MDYSNVLVKNYPGTKWKMEDASDYDTLEWYDETSKPSKDDLNTKLAEINAAEPLRLLRLERDSLLKQTDWRASSDLIISEEWKIYRQRLRDLPAGNSPDLDSNGKLDFSSVNWPTPPS